jgi:hypothetical protein
LEGLDISLINKMTKLSIIEINELKSQIK